MPVNFDGSYATLLVLNVGQTRYLEVFLIQNTIHCAFHRKLLNRTKNELQRRKNNMAGISRHT
jgi:hypothetical protein